MDILEKYFSKSRFLEVPLKIKQGVINGKIHFVRYRNNR